MTWLSADDALRYDFDAPNRPYSDAPAPLGCGLTRKGRPKQGGGRCPERFFTEEARKEHRQQVHGVGWPHGIRARYHAGCRCGPCRRANADYVAELRRVSV